ncbi:hypothetical protein E3T26_15080 [Cryobacterium sp. TMT1-21]|uniref:DUF2238 domain-containing protein n=1 Tax=Cryobacterium shii TaxID=1259235 RepID=A0AAQ2HFB8_9MICO|nr:MULTISPECIES: hypothetical protein [Cryobacterium]TFC45880.1 hypothetical protein E3O49_10210 [Cryobacterium shii]TFC84403.1 hypothetical protein E3T24_10445 [Cryobacterium sp. TmT2-59]TFD08705.1 hypothetical protein E3T26_15080 [Cryobacterium sp. TMT1-21]TFD18495.1 hypothetical protein E3T42_05800 [Cryobacterium sp. TMT4-10]TFD26278.1 hypothetical protein E3T32_03110 [Cryobacterium sp. TMT2-23]
MIRSLLRTPSGAAETVADGLRVLALIGIVIAALGWGTIAGLSLAVVFVGMFFPRVIGVRPSVDIAFGTVVLIAVWSSVLQIYISTRWWDLPVHLVTNGLSAALCYLLFVRLGVLADTGTLRRPTISAIVMTTALGLSLGVLWEVFEWFGHTFIDSEIFVGYVDTIGDLVWGGIGALLAGCCMPFLTGRSADLDRSPRSVRG